MLHFISLLKGGKFWNGETKAAQVGGYGCLWIIKWRGVQQDHRTTGLSEVSGISVTVWLSLKCTLHTLTHVSPELLRLSEKLLRNSQHFSISYHSLVATPCVEKNQSLFQLRTLMIYFSWYTLKHNYKNMAILRCVIFLVTLLCSSRSLPHLRCLDQAGSNWHCATGNEGNQGGLFYSEEYSHPFKTPLLQL